MSVNSTNRDSEKYLERKLKKLIDNKGGLCLKLSSQDFTGLPDRLCLLIQGKVLFVEVKTKGKKPRKIQTVVHEKLRSLGFKVFILDSFDAFQTLENLLSNE